MSYWKQTEITDRFNVRTRNTMNGELRTMEGFRTAGRVLSGSVVDPNFFSSTATNGGSATQSNGVLTLATNTTANGAIQVNAESISRYVGAAQMEATARIAMGDTGTANNVRRWGMMDLAAQNGVYFKLSGSTMYVCTLSGGVETAIASASWNQSTVVPTLTNYNLWQIQYMVSSVNFIINGTLVHQISGAPSSASWAQTLNLYLWTDNTNSGGSTTNVNMLLKSAHNYRFGKHDTQNVYFHGTTAATTVLKYGPGTLHRMTLNNPGGTLITLYDNTAGSGTVIAVINTPSTANPVTLTYEIEFNIGLTVVSTGTWDFTIIYQ